MLEPIGKTVCDARRAATSPAQRLDARTERQVSRVHLGGSHFRRGPKAHRCAERLDHRSVPVAAVRARLVAHVRPWANASDRFPARDRRGADRAGTGVRLHEERQPRARRVRGRQGVCAGLRGAGIERGERRHLQPLGMRPRRARCRAVGRQSDELRCRKHRRARPRARARHHQHLSLPGGGPGARGRGEVGWAGARLRAPRPREQEAGACADARLVVLVRSRRARLCGEPRREPERAAGDRSIHRGRGQRVDDGASPLAPQREDPSHRARVDEPVHVRARRRPRVGWRAGRRERRGRPTGWRRRRSRRTPR